MGCELKKRTVEVVADKIRAYIHDNHLAPQSPLPSIEKLSVMFAVSKATLREALQTLSTSGAVEIRQGKGTYVADPTMAGLFHAMPWRDLAKNMTMPELMETRIAVETMTARLAARRITLSQIKELKELVFNMDKALERADYQQFARLDEQFHKVIAQAAMNRPLADLASILWELLFATIDTNRLTLLASKALNYHERIAQAIQERDPERASQLTARHIEELDQVEPQKDMVIYYDVLGTGSVGGSFYTIGQGISKLIGTNTRIKPAINVTGGGIENVKLAQDRLITLGITQADVAFDAFHGKNAFEYPHSNIRVICCLLGLELQISTLASSEIHTLSDLRGRRVALGAHGGASVNVATSLLERAGLHANKDYDPKILSFSSSVDMMRDGELDAVFYLSIGQSPALLELALEQPIRLIPVQNDLIERLTSNHPYWYPSCTESGTYPGQTGSINTIGIPTILVTHTDLPDSDAYDITSSILKHSEDIQSLVWPRRPFTFQNAALEVGIPYHTGAARFFAETALIHRNEESS